MFGGGAEDGLEGPQAVVEKVRVVFRSPSGVGGGRRSRGQGWDQRGRGGSEKGWTWGMDMKSIMEIRGWRGGDNTATIKHRDTA